MGHSIPTRFQPTAAARATFGADVDRLAPFLLVGDPLADAVVAEGSLRSVDRALARGVDRQTPPALRALFAAIEATPSWVDLPSYDRAGRTLLRSGALGGLVLGVKSLVNGYASPGGNKPLAFTGRLEEAAPRRLAETARYVYATCSPGGLRRDGEGFALAVRVRLMHAKVRSLLLRDPRWSTAAWGVPINQHDMTATALLFSTTVVEGLRQLGARIDRDEADAYIRLWRYAAWLMGTNEELLPTTDREAERLARLIVATEGPPDDDSRALTRALLRSGVQGARTPEQERLGARRDAIGAVLCRYLLGNEKADGLGVPRTPAFVAGSIVRGLVGAFEGARERSIDVEAYADVLGERYWQLVFAEAAHGPPMDFAPPTRLREQAAAPP